MAKKQLPYFQRVKEEDRPPIRVTERDLDILEFIADYRFLTSTYLSYLLPLTSKEALRRRLKKMYHNEVLNRPKRQRAMRLFEGQRDFIYSLGPKGVTALVRGRDMKRKDIKWQVKSVKSIHMKHTLMIARFRITLLLATKSPERIAEERFINWTKKYKAEEGSLPPDRVADSVFAKLIEEEKEDFDKFKKNEKLDPTVELKFWKQGKEAWDKAVIRNKKTGKRKKFPIAPDGFFKLYFPHKPEKEKIKYWYLEADRGTMDSKRFLRKMKAYWNYKLKVPSSKNEGKKEIKGFRVLTITEDRDRSEFLRKITRKANSNQRGSDKFWFGCELDWSLEKPRDILRRVFKTASTDTKKSILE